MALWFIIALYIIAGIVYLIAWIKITLKAFNVSAGWGWTVLLFNPLLNIPAVCFMYQSHEKKMRSYTLALFAPYLVLLYFLIRHVDWASLI